jgi:hypothetical protein
LTISSSGEESLESANVIAFRTPRLLIGVTTFLGGADNGYVYLNNARYLELLPQARQILPIFFHAIPNFYLSHPEKVRIPEILKLPYLGLDPKLNLQINR